MRRFGKVAALVKRGGEIFDSTRVLTNAATGESRFRKM